MGELAEKLQLIRRFTGNRFSAARGYDARKPLSRRRQKTIDKYHGLISDMLARPHVVMTPKKGTKKEVFEYTGQAGYSYFQKAIIHTPDPEASVTFGIDKSRPKGSRFIVTNKRSGERSWHVPAKPFWDVNDEQDAENEDLDPFFFEDILQQYAEDAETFLIQAGDHYMWGSAGGHAHVAGKLADLFKQYGSQNFDPWDRQSHHIGNWFRGVTAYASLNDVFPFIRQKANDRYKARQDAGLDPNTNVKVRVMRDGSLGRFENGKLDFKFRAEDAVPVRAAGETRDRAQSGEWAVSWTNKRGWTSERLFRTKAQAENFARRLRLDRFADVRVFRV